ncbi:MAG: PorV/PorQ family protein [Candidatus Zixiibacteriota bacterium]|nr:MAG: PorV/PorQ family protein [candidate division Zixibacteria bacterium]
MRKLISIISLLLVFPWQCVLGEAEDGGYAGAFLKMAVAARPAAMGGAYYGLSDDLPGQLFNPAGLTAITDKTFSSSYRVMQLDRSLGFLSIAFPARLQSTLALGWLYAGYGEVTARNRSGRELGRTISSNEHVFAATFAKQFLPFLGGGVKLNYYYKKLDIIDANSVGINLGALLAVDSLFEYGSMEGKAITDIKIGLVFNNIAAKYPWTTNEYWEKYGGRGSAQDDEFPFVLAGGVSCRTFRKSLLVAFDLEKNFEQAVVARFGGEYNITKQFFLRSGLNEGVLTAGFGLLQRLEWFGFSFDYAFSAERADEGSDHIVTLNVTF